MTTSDIDSVARGGPDGNMQIWSLCIFEVLLCKICQLVVSVKTSLIHGTTAPPSHTQRNALFVVQLIKTSTVLELHTKHFISQVIN
jgi:hypothetical protein